MKNNAEKLIPYPVKKQVEQTKTDLKKLETKTNTKFLLQGKDIKCFKWILGFLFLFLTVILGAVISVPLYINKTNKDLKTAIKGSIKTDLASIEKDLAKIEKDLATTKEELKSDLKTTKEDLNTNITLLQQYLLKSISKIDNISKTGKLGATIHSWGSTPEKNETTK